MQERNLLRKEYVGPLVLLVVSQKDARGHFGLFHQKEHQPLELHQFDIDMHLRVSLQHDAFLSSLNSAFCTLADSELIP